MNLRTTARGRPCQIRVPGVLRDPKTVVLCHVRMVEIPTKNFPGRDLLAAFGCYQCHAIVDGQQNTNFTRDERQLMLLEAVMRTQAIWLREGLITIGRAA